MSKKSDTIEGAASSSNLQPQPPSPDWCCYQKGDVLLILSDSVVNLDSTFDFETDTCLIFSESIVISTSTLSLSEKNLGLFCNQLTLPTGDGQIEVDVSGSPGQVSQPASPPNAGGSGGTVWLYVENLTLDLANGLSINACGGDGGAGWPNTDSTGDGTGGDGGNGGNGGTINIYYGSVSKNVQLLLSTLISQPWPTQVNSGLNSVLPTFTSLPGFDSTTQQEAETVFEIFSKYQGSATALLNSLQKILSATGNFAMPQPQQQTLTEAKAAFKALDGMLQSSNAPNLSQATDTSPLDNLTQMIQDWFQEGGGDTLEGQIQTGMTNLVSQLIPSQNNNLLGTFDDIYSDLVAISDKLATQLHLSSNCQAGNGGQGGSGATPQDQPGERGSDGTIGARNFINLGFNGSADDLNVNQVCAFPEQCQMVLNKADRLFFTNSDDSDTMDAARLYTRLTERLAFVPALIESQKQPQQSETPEVPLETAYTNVEVNLQLTISPLTQLQSIYSQAKNRLNCISLGEDMFGHSVNWAPRLSYSFYQGEVNELLTFLQQVETTTNDYCTALQNSSSAAAAIEQSISNSQQSEQNAKDKIQVIGGPNGLLATSDAKINLLTPVLAAKRAAIETSMAIVEYDIQNKLNFDMDTILNAFASLAMAPSKASAAAQAANVAYKTWTTVDNDQGVPVNKDYIISQLTTCGSDLASLNEAFTTNQDGTIDVDDPGSLKIIATVDDIEQLVAEYKSAIPSDHSAMLDAALDDYMNTISQRNTSVLNYNAAVQLLNEAIKDFYYYQSQNASLGQKALQIDPNLPTIYFWLQQMQNSLQLDIMQRLNYGARALSFWGLDDTSAFTTPGPLQGYTDLKNNQKDLSERFEQCVESFSSSLWSVWPAQTNELGLLYQLTPDELSTLLQGQLDPDEQTSSYGVFLTFTPDDSPSVFAAMANVRLSQVRFWLIGAAVQPQSNLNRELLTVEIEHLGQETLVAPSGQSFNFNHDAVNLQFIYDTASVSSIQDCGPSIVFSTEEIEQDYTGGQPTQSSIAPLGPFTTWRVQIKETENFGLDLSKVTEGYMEFCGRNMPFIK